MSKLVLVQLLIILTWGYLSIPFAGANSFDPEATQTVFYKGRPLHVEIPVGAERLLEFGRSIEVGIPIDIDSVVKAQSIAGTVFITASEPFEGKRFWFRDRETKEIVLLDITARQGAELLPLRVLSKEQAQEMVASIEKSSVDEAKVQPPGMIATVRYAFQQVYSPERLIDDVDGIYAVNVDTKRVFKHLVPGHKVLAKPLAQWRTVDGSYVTAIYMKNTERRNVLLDPRALRAGGGWQTAAFRDGVLAPVGSYGDSTTLVIVSDRAWSGSAQWLR